MPGAVPWTATQALNNSTLPYILQLANGGREAIGKNKTLFHGLNVDKYALVHPIIQNAFPDL